MSPMYLSLCLRTTVKEGIKNFFALHIEMAFSDDFPKGCLVTNAAISSSSPDEEFHQLVRESFEDLEKIFYEFLKKDNNQGKLIKLKI